MLRTPGFYVDYTRALREWEAYPFIGNGYRYCDETPHNQPANFGVSLNQACDFCTGT
ncbi:hypothetical protein BH11ARM2_BH11ARM2_33200 [soil metagenome]